MDTETNINDSFDLDKIINNPVNIVLAVILVDIIALVLAKNNLIGEVVKEWYIISLHLVLL